MERELEFADEIYIFVSPDKPGIKFYDKSPYGAVAKFSGSLPEDKFQTSIHSISQVEWDKEVNIPNKSQLIRCIDGSSYTVTTIMVSSEKMKEILQTISESEDKTRIIIDVMENKLDKNKSSYLRELQKMRKDFMEDLNSINKDSFDEIGFDNKKIK